MPRYRVTFSDVSIREMFVEAESEEQLLEDYIEMTEEIELAIENSVEVDSYYDRDLLIEICDS